MSLRACFLRCGVFLCPGLRRCPGLACPSANIRTHVRFHSPASHTPVPPPLPPLPCPLPAAAEHHTIHGGHGKHGVWGMGSTLVMHNKRRDSVEGSEADLLLGGSPRSDRTFMSTRDKVGRRGSNRLAAPLPGHRCSPLCQQDRAASGSSLASAAVSEGTSGRVYFGAAGWPVCGWGYAERGKKATASRRRRRAACLPACSAPGAWRERACQADARVPHPACVLPVCRRASRLWLPG